MAKKHTARCACGAVRFEFNTDSTFIADCNCLDCRKASGGAMATWFAVPEDDFTLISGKPRYRRLRQRTRPQLLSGLRGAAL